MSQEVKTSWLFLNSINNTNMTNNSLQLFQFESNEIRFVEVDGQPCIVATDLLKASDSSLPVTRLEAMIEKGLGGCAKDCDAGVWERKAEFLV